MQEIRRNVLTTPLWVISMTQGKYSNGSPTWRAVFYAFGWLILFEMIRHALVLVKVFDPYCDEYIFASWYGWLSDLIYLRYDFVFGTVMSFIIVGKERWSGKRSIYYGKIILAVLSCGILVIGIWSVADARVLRN